MGTTALRDEQLIITTRDKGCEGPAFRGFFHQGLIETITEIDN
jgi:hypothetical protein